MAACMLVGIKWLLLLFQNSGISYLVKTSPLYFEQFFVDVPFLKSSLVYTTKNGLVERSAT